jgi:hypothetical protein
VHFEGRTEEGENGVRRHRAAPFLSGTVGSRRRRGGGVRGRWHGAPGGKRGMRGPGLDRRAASRRSRPGRVARGWRDAVRIGEREGPLTCGPWPAVGGRGREEEWGHVGQPGGKRSGPSPKEQENF